MNSPRRPLRVAAAVATVLFLSPALARGATLQERSEAHLEAAMDGGLKPAVYHHLILALSWRDDLPDRHWADAALDRLTAVSGADPLMTAELHMARAQLAMEEGHPEAARELFRTDGGLERWWAAGPHSLEELNDFPTQATAPPADADWRAVPGTDPLGWVGLDGLGWPGERQFLWMATTVSSATTQPVALRLGTAQAARVWVNGELCGATDFPLTRGADQLSCGAWLRRGHNSIVAAVATERGGWWLRLRLTQPSGAPLQGVHELAEKPQTVPGLGRPAPAVRDMASEIQKAVDSGTPGARMAWAAWVLTHNTGVQGSGAGSAAAQAARDEAPGEARYLEARQTDEPGAQWKLLNAALDAEPDFLPARLSLARWYEDHGLAREAHATLAPALDEPAAAAQDLDTAAERWGETALPALDRLAERYPSCVTVLETRASRLLDAGRWATARRAVAALEAILPGDGKTADLAERLGMTCGDQEALRRQARRWLEMDPNRPALRIRLARFDQADGNAKDARKVLQRGLERCPDHVDLIYELARLEHAEGRDREASRLVAHLLELRPQDRRAQRLSDRMGGAAEDRSWIRPEATLRKMTVATPASDSPTRLLEHHEVRFLPGNLTEELVQRVILVGDPKKADEFRQMSVPYVPERQRLRVLAARILRSGGGQATATQQDTPRLADPSINMYYDTRLRILRYPELHRGDLLELCYILSETAEANETGAYMGGIVVIPNDTRVELAEVELDGPEQLLPSWELANIEGTPLQSRDDDGTVHLRWSWKGIPAASPDLPRPPAMLTTPHLAYSNHPDWGDLADWYQRHVGPRLLASRQVIETAHRLTRGLATREQRIAALYRFVTDKIRYVALEFGEHRFRPFSADWVLRHRMGDCKDKAALLVSLLSTLDIPARMVLIRTADQGPVAVTMGLLSDFNHAIAYLPDEDRYLDGTATGHDPARPPGPDQGAWALVIDGPESRPRTTPRTGAGEGHRTVRITAPGAGKPATITVALEATGDAADRIRGAFAGSQDRQRFARWLQRLFPSASLDADPVTALVAGQDPARVTLEASVPPAVLESAPGLRAYPGRFELANSLAPAAHRSTPLLIPERPDLRWSLEVDLGHVPAPLPEDVHLAGPHGRLDLEFRASATGYTVTGAFHLQAGLVPADAYPGLHDFLVRVDRELSRRMEAP